MGLKSGVLTTCTAIAVLTVQFSDLSITTMDKKEQSHRNFFRRQRLWYYMFVSLASPNTIRRRKRLAFVRQLTLWQFKGDSWQGSNMGLPWDQ